MTHVFYVPALAQYQHAQQKNEVKKSLSPIHFDNIFFAFMAVLKRMLKKVNQNFSFLLLTLIASFKKVGQMQLPFVIYRNVMAQLLRSNFLTVKSAIL